MLVFARVSHVSLPIPTSGKGGQDAQLSQDVLGEEDPGVVPVAPRCARKVTCLLRVVSFRHSVHVLLLRPDIIIVGSSGIFASITAAYTEVSGSDIIIVRTICICVRMYIPL